MLAQRCIPTVNADNGKLQKKCLDCFVTRQMHLINIQTKIHFTDHDIRTDFRLA